MPSVALPAARNSVFLIAGTSFGLANSLAYWRGGEPIGIEQAVDLHERGQRQRGQRHQVLNKTYSQHPRQDQPAPAPQVERPRLEASAGDGGVSAAGQHASSAPAPERR